jgi:hypothetical protein
MTWDNVNDSKTLKLKIASNKHTFILIPGKNKAIKLFHDIILVPQKFGEVPVMIRIQGNQSTSPFQAIPIEDITIVIKSKRITTKSDKKWSAPSFIQFLEVSNKEDFDGLVAKERAKIPEGTNFEDIP